MCYVCVTEILLKFPTGHLDCNQTLNVMSINHIIPSLWTLNNKREKENLFNVIYNKRPSLCWFLCLLRDRFDSCMLEDNPCCTLLW